MGKRRRGHKQVVPVYDSDDERAYSKEAVPDPKSSEFYSDEIDDFHSKREKILLDKGASLQPAGFSSDEDEVLAVESSDDEGDLEDMQRKLMQFQRQGFKDELDSDLEDSKDDGLPDSKAWGKKKQLYYQDDDEVSDYDSADASGSEPDDAALEEQEALAIQKKLAAQFEEQDFTDFIKPIQKPEAKESKEKIEKDLSKLSKREKMQLLKKESPELLDMIEEYKSKVTELKDRLMPIHDLIVNGILPESKATKYIETKVSLCLNYCTNISFYMMLKAKHAPVHNHPVISRLLQYRNLLAQLAPVDEQISPEVDNLLVKIRSGEEIKIAATETTVSIPKKASKAKKSNADKDNKKEKRRLSDMLEDDSSEEEETALPEGGRTWGRDKKARKTGSLYETTDEKQALEYYKMMKAGYKDTEVEEVEAPTSAVDMEGKQETHEGDWDVEDEERRAITRQIEKNRGLTPHRKKELRNPRVKHRMKYRKALIRRKGKIRDPRPELTKYAGELTGIRAGVKRSVKFK